MTLDIPTNPSIQLRSTAFDDYATIDIAEFARDLVEVTFNGTQDSNAVWVQYQIIWVDNRWYYGYRHCGSINWLDGFSYFEDGVNYQYSENVLMGQDTIRTMKITQLKFQSYKTF